MVLALFGRTTGFDFVSYDDPAYVFENEKVSAGLTVEGMKWAATETGETNLWHPLTWVSHMVDVEVFGLENPGGHHGVNVLWHVVGALGFFFLLKRLTGSVGLSLVVALIWAIHPMRVQSVAWISERKDVLSGAFFFWSWWSWEKWTASKAKRWYGLALGLFVLAGLSKPSVVPLPVIFWVGQVLRERWSMGNAVRWGVKVIPFVMVSMLVAGLTMYFQRTGGMSDVTDVMPWQRRLMLMPVSLWWYVQGLVWPGEGRLWVYPPKGELKDLLVPGVGIFVMGLVAVLVGRKSRLAMFGVVAFLLLWGPVSGVVPVSFYFVADRYSYLIHAGLLVAVAGLVDLVWRNLEPGMVRRLANGCGVLVVVLAGLCSWERVGYWINDEVLFSHEREINPRSLLAPIHLGAVRTEQGREEEALALYREALAIDGESGLAATNAGRMLAKLGRAQEAEEMYREAGEKMILRQETPFRALALLQTGRKAFGEAGASLRRGLVRFPNSLEMRMDLGALAQRHDKNTKAALALYEEVLAIDPSHAGAMQGKGVALIEMGRLQEGRVILHELVRRYPEKTAVKKFLESQ